MLIRAGFGVFSCLWEFLPAVDPSKSAANLPLAHRDIYSTSGWRQRPVPREKWPLFHVPAGIAAVHFRLRPAPKGQAGSSPTAAPPVRNHLLIADRGLLISKLFSFHY